MHTITRLLGGKIQLLILLICMLGINQAKASHATGADLTYEFIGNGQYRVTFTFYRDCGGQAGAFPIFDQELVVSSASCSFNSSYTMDTVPGMGTGYEITHPCSSATTVCATPPGTEPGIRQYQYSTIVTLPAQCPDWQFSATVNARNAAITTIQNPDFFSLYVDAYLNNTISDNNSPSFTNFPVAFECIGQPNYFNQGVIDADGDSLVYSFIAPRSAVNQPLPYKPGYSIAAPIVSSPPVSINSSTGDIVMNPTQADIAAVAVLVQEFRNGEIIGSVMRDMQLYIVPCSNTLPSVSGINGSNNFATSSCIGGQLCFDVQTTDQDPNQVLTMTWNQGIPGATFTITGATYPVGHFCWAPTPGDARPQPYTFTVTVRDNACPSNGTFSTQYNIVVSNMTVQLTSTPSITCHGDHNGSASAIATGNPPLQYSWTFPGGTIATGPSVTHLDGGNYTLNVIDGNGCVGTEHFTILEPPALVVSVTPTSAGCGGSFGSALANVAGGTPSYRYLWSPGGQTTQNATNLTTNTYTVRVTDDHSCTSTASAAVQSSTPVSFALHLSGATCLANDGSASVTHTGGTGNFSYHWTPDVAGDSTSSSISGLITGSYSVIATDLGTGCSQSMTGIVQNLAGITATITGSSDATCENSDDGSATVAAAGGQSPYIYLWPNGDTTSTTDHLSPGTYLAMVEDYNGCRAYASVTIGFTNPSPVVNLGLDTMPCTGVPYMMDAGAGFIAYLWSDNSTNQTLTVTASASYSVSVTNSQGCQNSDAIIVTFVTCAGNPGNPGNPGNTNLPTQHSIISIYPNPANEEVNISVSRIRNTDVTLTLSDILGNKIYHSRDLSESGYIKKIDLHQLPAGIYLVRVEFNDEIKTLRVIKQ